MCMCMCDACVTVVMHMCVMYVCDTCVCMYACVTMVMHMCMVCVCVGMCDHSHVYEGQRTAFRNQFSPPTL